MLSLLWHDARLDMTRGIRFIAVFRPPGTGMSSSAPIFYRSCMLIHSSISRKELLIWRKHRSGTVSNKRTNPMI
jgi:hypothetical protein